MQNNILKLLGIDYNLENLVGKEKGDIDVGNSQLNCIYDFIDTNSDGVISKEEASIFSQLINQADVNSDGNISKKELKKSFLKKISANLNLKIDVDSMIEIISSLTTKKIKESPQDMTIDIEMQSKTYDEVQEMALDSLEEEVNNGYQIFNENDNGVVGKTYNQIKEIFATKLSESSVAKSLFIKNETIELLKRAKAGDLTKLEYYEIIKYNLYQTFPEIEKMDDSQKEKLKKLINTLHPEYVEMFQKQILLLPSPNDEEYAKKLSTFFNDFWYMTHSLKTKQNIKSNENLSYQLESKYESNPSYFLDASVANEKMTFEELYKIRNGVNFDQQKIQEYEELRSQYALQQSFIQIKDTMHRNLDNVTSSDSIEKSILDFVRTLTDASDDETLTGVLQHMSNNPDVQVVNGKIITNDLQSLKQALLAKMDSQVEEITLGKSYEELQEKLEKAYKSAYGSENVEILVKAYKSDQENFVKNARKMVEITAGAASLIGMFTCAPLAIGAGVVASFGGVGLELLDESTKQMSSDEKIQTLKKELEINLALLPAGLLSGAAGSATGSVVSVLAKSSPRLMAMIAERGVDATLSLISTMAITGELDLKGVGLSQLMAVLTGLKSSKVSIKNSQSVDETMGFIAPWARKAASSVVADINPNSPLNKYKLSGGRYNMNHADFHSRNSHLFKGNNVYDCWTGKSSSDPRHGAWKMHLYSVSEQDWQRMADVIIPYLKEHDIDWKTFNSSSPADCLNGTSQQGKAFTIYPKNNADFEKIARDLDYIIRNNNLNTTNTHIEGDRALGTSGRIFYRYEFKSKQQMNEILDLSPGSPDWNKYHSMYDGNSDRIARNGGSGRYLADDMTPADDPWYNFDPSKPQNSSKNMSVNNNRHYYSSSRAKMLKNQYYEFNAGSKLNLPDGAVIDFNDPYIQARLSEIPEGQAVYVGRNSDCFIRIRPECGHVSGYHLVIYKQNGRIYVQDISRNGTDILQ